MSDQILQVEADSEKTSATAILGDLPLFGDVPFLRAPFIMDLEDLTAAKAVPQGIVGSGRSPWPIGESAHDGSHIIILDEPDTVGPSPKAWLASISHAGDPVTFWALAFLLQERRPEQKTVFQILLDDILSYQRRNFTAQRRNFTAGQEWVVNSYSRTIEDISQEARQRLKGHERLAQAVSALATEDAQARGLSLLKIDVRPAWSHEYDEHTGVVIDVEVQATPDERFAYWDAVCERLHQLDDTLPPEEQHFLNNELAFIVSRS